MFLTAATWNWILAIAFFTLPRIDVGNFEVVGLEIPNTMLWFDSLMGLIFVFGIGFYIVSQNMIENHGLIMMAVFENLVLPCGCYMVLLWTGFALGSIGCNCRPYFWNSVH